MLLGLAIGLSVVTMMDLQPDSTSSTLPVLVEMLKDDVQRIELTQQGNKIVLEKSNEEWVQVSPLNGVADWARIKAMILNFRKSISMDVLVDPNPTEDGKAYGLDASNSITVEMWKSDSSMPEISFEIGEDAGEGASFVRLNGDESVYRAHIGGRRRFAYDASDWLNQRLLQFDVAEMTAVQIEYDDLQYTLVKTDDVWGIQGFDEALDAQKLSMALQSLSVMRIGERVEQTLQTPWMTMTFQVANQSIPMQVATPVERMALVSLEGQNMTVPVTPLERFTYGPAYFKDMRVLSIGARDELDLIRYTTDVIDIIIQQDLSNGFWKVLQPTNIDLEMRDVFFMVNTLSSLSSVQEVPLPTDQSALATIDIRRLVGDVQRLLIYGPKEDGILCAVEGQDVAFIAPEEDVERILNGFGQSTIVKK
jgi:hypothetical protein